MFSTWNSINNASDVHDDCLKLSTTIMKCIQQSSHEQTFFQDSASPRIIIDISNSCKYKHALNKKYLKGEVSFDSFELYRNKLTSIIIERKNSIMQIFMKKIE